MDAGQSSKQLFKLNDQATTYKRPSLQELLERNAKRAQDFTPILTFDDLSNLPVEKQIPMPKIFIVSCDDPRIIASDFLGLKQWDAVVATGVAGRIAHQFENMLFLDHFLHFEDIMIIHHTNCSAGIFMNDEIHKALEERAPGHPTIQLPGYEE
ncbi:hypothetical protein H0G86_004994 [Trichoderma simmonsii]|uniref:Carbonic anhydrase n=1 Tax=Trichoderma simmonsii TaxID=1491479 RepID=A0A8G0L8V1_9HYPO|nr:hypothetical protein H0G86_004994 [Trichoderma simmonsii]